MPPTDKSTSVTAGAADSRPRVTTPPPGSTDLVFLQAATVPARSATPAPASRAERTDRGGSALGASERTSSSTDAVRARARAEDDEGEQAPLLTEPAGGVPDVIDDERALVRAARALGAGSGPLAVDAERASGYRYGQHAYLVQLKRAGAGIVLVDPVACPDLSPIQEATRGVEWILHAATQDLPCLAELGLFPDSLFDTEVGCRLLGLPKVGLGTVVEHYLGVRLAKEHSAVDWSTRPLPEPWLTYAALDVEVLADLRDEVAADLRRKGKKAWAQQEFEALTHFTGPAPKADPWRRTHGMHKIRNRRGAALVRELWQARDRLAREKDLSPGRVLPDAALVELAVAALHKSDAGASGGHKSIRRHASTWRDAIDAARRIPEDDLPPLTVRSDTPPPVKAWKDRRPVAADRLTQVKEGIAAFGEKHAVPPENVLSPSLLRQVVWDLDEEEGPAESRVREMLAEQGARPWQIDVVAPLIAQRHAGDEVVDGTEREAPAGA